MKNKSLFIGIVGFGLGMGAGYFIGVKRVKEQYKNDLAEVKDFYASKLNEMGVQPDGFDPDENVETEVPRGQRRKLSIVEETNECVEEMSEEYFNKLSGYSSAATGAKGKAIINYSKPPIETVQAAFAATHPDDDDDYPEDLEDPDPDEAYEAELDARAEELAKRRYENQSNGKPYVINHTEYEDAPENYERIVLYYYSEDRTLCGDDDTVIEVDDEESIVGLDYEDTLDMQTTAWVRNDVIMNVYQIHRIDESYARSVQNVLETPREREFRITSRRKYGLDC